MLYQLEVIRFGLRSRLVPGLTAKAAKDAVLVQVRRKRGLGSEYGAFGSIKVALRNAKDEADDPLTRTCIR